MEGGPVHTTCPYCGVGCGVVATLRPDGQIAVRGDPDHPANFGKLCSKGMALGETMGLEGRLLEPEIGGQPASWGAALDLVARKFTETIAAHGPDSVAFYVSGQLLTEDYYVANKLMKGFVGSGNIDTNSRLCMASSVAGHRRAFGEDIVPGTYEDLEQADLVVLVGSNTAWCHPILYQRLLSARSERGTKIVVIDPRRTATAEECDLHLQVDPGTDVLLFNGLFAHLEASGRLDRAFVDTSTTGFDEAVSAARADAASLERVALGCGLAEADLSLFYRLFAATERTVTVYSQGVNQSAHGTDKVNAIINCHLATGRIGKPGMGPFSVTGQPNAMGGREVGGLANQLAAHMNFEDAADIDRVARFWSAPDIARKPGLKAVDLFEAVGDGRVKALWIMGTNPAVSMPDAVRVRKALKSCAFVVVSDVTRTDTTRHADVLLPAAGWGEKDGTATNSERRISRQRPFVPVPGSARPDWRIICDVAKRMGHGDAFSYAGPADIFREHASLSAFENDGARLFDIGAMADVTDRRYDAFTPQHWPMTPTGTLGSRLLGDGRFPTADGRARFVAVRHAGVALATDPERPIGLNSGRLRDQWHTMTRTGHVARLASNAPEPALDMAPADAAAHGLADGDLAEIASAWGTARAIVRISADQKAGSAFLPMHWSGHFAANAGAGPLFAPLTDAVSGQPELKHVPVRLRREAAAWTALLISRRDMRPTGFVHWSRHKVEGGWVHELCGTEPPEQGILLARGLLDPAGRARMIEYADRRGHGYRAAMVDEDGALVEALFVAPARQLPSRDWLLSLLATRAQLSLAERMALLSGQSPVPMPATGRIICACFNVGEIQIADAVMAGSASVEEIGQVLQAGTNCGSCRAEIRKFLHEDRLQAAE
ncbi:MAG: molybdopterin-dependent oxidoreductase [Rhizobiaceae bacterium]